MSAVGQALTSITRPPRSRVASAATPKPPAVFGPNHGEVAAFIKGVGDLSPIQWLRVLDRRKLVSSVTREGTPEPAGVVRSIIAALESTRALDMYTRCRAFSAVERAGYALESHAGRNLEEIRSVLAPFVPPIAFEELNGGGFAQPVFAGPYLLVADESGQVVAYSPTATAGHVRCTGWCSAPHPQTRVLPIPVP